MELFLSRAYIRQHQIRKRSMPSESRHQSHYLSMCPHTEHHFKAFGKQYHPSISTFDGQQICQLHTSLSKCTPSITPPIKVRCTNLSKFFVSFRNNSAAS
mmetsp:Transcript_12491/g.23089  ORF Transcript_12491/g.23089 Transcript_12491/m.23089 type:complete len:100 (-) Transcript_12491:689-988(-)